MAHDVHQAQLDQCSTTLSIVRPCRQRGVQAGERIGDGIADDQPFAAGLAHQCRQARRHASIVAIGDPLRLRFVATVAADAQPSKPRLRAYQGFCVDAELPQRAWPRGFDDDIGLRDQCQQLLASARTRQIERDAALALVECVEETRRSCARTVGSTRALDLDDLRAE